MKKAIEKAEKDLEEASKQSWGAWLANGAYKGVSYAASTVSNGVNFVIEKGMNVTGLTALGEAALDKMTGIPTALKKL